MGETEIPLKKSIPDFAKQLKKRYLPKNNPQISNASTKNTR